MRRISDNGPHSAKRLLLSLVATAFIGLSLVPSSSDLVEAAITTGETAKFKIESLTVSTTNRTVREVEYGGLNLTGDDRGGIALSGSKVFLTGDSYLGVFDKSTLMTGSRTTRNAACHDGIVSDLKTMTSYCFDVGASSFTKLTQIDQDTGVVPSSPTVITLSSAIPVNSNGEIYSGYGRVVYRNGSTGRVYDIDMPSGTVYDRGTVTVTRMGTEQYNGTAWGVAEFFDSELWLTVAGPTYPVNTITRYKVSDGTTQVVASSGGLNFSEMASFTVDPVSQRWYFHYEGNASAFGHGVDENLGFASAVITTTPSVSVVPSSTLTNSNSLSYGVTFGEAVTGLTTSDFTVGGTANGWSITGLTAHSSTSYTLALSQDGNGSGTVTMSLAANAVTWTAGSTSIPESAVVASTVTVDHDPPTVTVATAPSSPAAAMTLTFGLTFSESISGLASGDFVNMGTALGCVFTPSSASGSNINVAVTQCQEGTLQLKLLENSVSDAAGNYGPTVQLTSNTITLAASPLSVTAADKSVSFGNAWVDGYSQTGLIGADSLSVSYSYSGATTLGTAYGPSFAKPTAGGTYTIIPAVSFGGSNANRYALTRNNGSLIISRVSQSGLAISSTTVTYGQTLALTTSGGSGTGLVTWSKVSGTCSLNGSTLTPGDAGSSCVLQATKAGDDNYTSVTSVNTSIATAQANQSALSVTSASATYGEQLTLISSGGSGTGEVSWSKVSGTCTVTVGGVLTPGAVGSSCVVKATKAGDTNHNLVESTNRSITIERASQSGFSITSNSSFTTGATHLLTTFGGQSSGSVSWAMTGGSCVLANASLTSTRGGVTCSVLATRNGDSNYLPATDAMTINVDKIIQTLTFRSSAPATVNPGGTYTVSVESDAFLAPTIAIANSSSSVCSISAGVVTFSAIGTCLISASQSGTDSYTSAAASQTVIVTAIATSAPVANETPSTTPSTVDDPARTTETTVVKKTVATTTTTSTSTTSTTIAPVQDPGAPNVGVNGKMPELAEGQTTALVRGKRVKVTLEQTNGQIVMRLPNKVVLRIGSSDPTSKSAQFNSDGVLVAYRGETIEVQAEGFVKSTTYTAYMFSEPVELGRGETTGRGDVSTVLTIPDDVETGGHTLQMNGVGANNEVVSVSLGFKVTERDSNTMAVVISLSVAILLALLGGRPIFRRRFAS